MDLFSPGILFLKAEILQWPMATSKQRTSRARLFRAPPILQPLDSSPRRELLDLCGVILAHTLRQGLKLTSPPTFVDSNV